MKSKIIETKRLVTTPRTIEEMQKLYGEEQIGELKQAYLEMLEEMKKDSLTDINTSLLSIRNLLYYDVDMIFG